MQHPGESSDFFEPIDRAYDWSSKQLINLILGDKCQLLKRLESIKHYFFMD
jgi:hypothetical protein